MTATEGLSKAMNEAMELHTSSGAKPSLLLSAGIVAGFKFLANHIDKLEAQLAEQRTNTGEPR